MDPKKRDESRPSDVYFVTGVFPPLVHVCDRPFRLPADYARRIRSICDPAGVPEIGAELIATLEGSLDLHRLTAIPFTANALAVLLLWAPGQLLSRGAGLRDVLGFAAAAPQLWDCLVEDPVIRSAGAGTLGSAAYWVQLFRHFALAESGFSWD
ncbi:MAG TPA: hypothetical protein VMJ64_09105 [Anaerolineales bacterium]|nr:hypothetical protein [Anaerolineales bacterium]